MIDISVNYLNIQAIKKLGKVLRKIIDNKTIIICIGNSFNRGDSLGPLIGTMIKERNISIPVFGDLNYPIHDLNIDTRIRQISNEYKEYKKIIVCGCHGNSNNLGSIRVKEKPIKASQDIGFNLGAYGDVSLKAIIDDFKYAKQVTDPQISLSFVYNVAVVIREAIIYATKEDESKVKLINQLNRKIRFLTLQIEDMRLLISKLSSEYENHTVEPEEKSNIKIKNMQVEVKPKKRTTIPNYKTKAEQLREEVLKKIGKL